MKTKIELATLAYIKNNAKLRTEIASILNKLIRKEKDCSTFGNSKEALTAVREFMKISTETQLIQSNEITRYTKWGIQRDKIKFVSDVPCFLYGKDAYIAGAFTELDVRKINESDGIVICTATWGQPIWRYAFVRPEQPTPEDIELNRYIAAGVRRDKILEVIGQSCTPYKNQFISTQIYTTLDVDKINNSVGIVASTELYGSKYWRYAFVQQKADPNLQQKAWSKFWGGINGTSLDITKADIEKKIGYEIEDMKLEPKYENGQCIGLDMTVQPKVAVDHIEVNFKVEDPDLKYCIILHSTSFESARVYECTSDWLTTKKIGECFERYDMFLHRIFPDYDIVNMVDDCRRSKVTLRRKVKKEPDWRIGSYYFKHSATILSPTTLESIKLYKLMSFVGFEVDGVLRTFDEHYNNFIRNFCNGNGFDYNKIDGIAYYKPIKK